MLGLWRVNTHFPSNPAFLAAVAAVAITFSGRPDKSFSLSMTSLKLLVSFSKFSPNCRLSMDNSLFNFLNVSLSAGERLAPPRTKP